MRARAARADLQADVEAVLDDWGASGKVARLWDGDATPVDRERRVALAGLARRRRRAAAPGRRAAPPRRDARADGFEHVLLLGMGGSSLAPEVLAETFGGDNGAPALRVLDSTDPAQVRAAEASIDLDAHAVLRVEQVGVDARAERAEEILPREGARRRGGPRRPAGSWRSRIPGSALEREARADGFRAVLHGRETIGGRYSALSNFGMAPGAVAGVDVVEMLERAPRRGRGMRAGTCRRTRTPVLVLGAVLGACALAGRDKVTLVASPAIADFGAWLEQLLAESTGKDGKGLIPVDAEPLGRAGGLRRGPAVRVPAARRANRMPDQDAAIDALAGCRAPGRAHRPARPPRARGAVLRVGVRDRRRGRAAGRQPVRPARRRGLQGEDARADRRVRGDAASCPEEEPILEEAGLSAFADERNADALGRPHLARRAAGRAPRSRATKGDYVALLPYIERSPEHEQALQEIRAVVRDRTRAATCVGFGPRFLHSTGQAYKGGPNTGVFLQITCDDVVDLEIPGQRLLVRRREGGAGARRPGRARRARAPRAAAAHRPRRRGGTAVARRSRHAGAVGMTTVRGGIDVGGTKMQAAVVERPRQGAGRGAPADSRHRAGRRGDRRARRRDARRARRRRGSRPSALQGVGVGWPGPVERGGRHGRAAPCTSWGWRWFPLTDALGAALGVPALRGQRRAGRDRRGVRARRGQGVPLDPRSVLGHRRGRRHRAGRQAVDRARLRRGDRPRGGARGRAPVSLRAPRVHGGLRGPRRDGGARAARGRARQAHDAVRHHGGEGTRPAHERHLGAGAAQGRPARDPPDGPRGPGARHGRGLGAQRARRRGGRDRGRAGRAARADVPRAHHGRDHDPPLLARSAGRAGRRAGDLGGAIGASLLAKSAPRSRKAGPAPNNFARSFVHMLFCGAANGCRLGKG